MLADITSALGAIKTSSDIAREMASAHSLEEARQRTPELFGAMAEIQHRLAAMQLAYASLLEERDALAREVEEIRRARLDRERYMLHALPQGGLVYRFKASRESGAVPHDLCVHCYESGVKSILQPNGSHLVCPTCKTKLRAKGAAAMSSRRGGVCVWTI
jgi:DNA repair exonuclease SbcCD ATPase subunit